MNFQFPNLIFLFLIQFISIACNVTYDRNNQSNIVFHEPVSNESIIKTELKTASNKLFRVIEDKTQGASLSSITIETEGFEVVNETHELGTTDPIEHLFLYDLDNNGYEELYLTTRSAGSGAYSSIYGIASNRDRSTSSIYIPPIEALAEKKKAYFKGFQGHNVYALIKGALTNTFPIYLENDSNSQPMGGEVRVVYALIAGEASWILEPVEQFRTQN